MKMLKLCPGLKNEIRPILAQYKEHWDEDLQQRACEYMYMIDEGDVNPTVKALVDTALDGMPNFSEELQTNNVLTRRILQMKVDKGFAMSKEEAEKTMKMNMNSYKTQVSKNLGASEVVDNDNMIAGIMLDDSKLSRLRPSQFIKGHEPGGQN